MLTFEIPDAAVEALALPVEEARRALLVDLAAVLYGRGALPIGKAMEMTGLNRRDFERALKERHVRRPFDEAELAHELSWELPER